MNPPSESVPTDMYPAVAGNTSGSDVESAQPLPGNTPAITGDLWSPHRKSTEEEDLAKAIELSLQNPTQAPAKDAFGSAARSSQSRSTTEQSNDFILRLNNEFDTLNDPNGDTAIYIGPPPQQPEQDDHDYRYIRAHFDRVYVVDSKSLRLMGDESKFTNSELLSPSKSFRSQRRLRKEHPGVLEKAEQKRGEKFRFTYYIDLRPAQEDEEAVILLTELTCTRGVLTWHLAQEKYGLAPLAVLGHDEFGTPSARSALVQREDDDTAAESSKADANEPTVTAKDNAFRPPTLKIATTEKPKIAPEYSALRHRSALERLIQAIQGNDPKLDSAPKVWTFFALARFFGCASHHRISGWITTWLYSGNNSNFIQNNPEVSYRIAMGTRSPDLLKDSFSILVGERALIEAYGEYRSQILNPLRQNVHGRKLEMLDDDERNRIDHAASSFVKRIRGITSSMCREMDFLHDSPTYRKLAEIVGNTQQELDTLNIAKKTIEEYVRSRIYFVLCQEQNQITTHELDLASTLPFRSATSDSFCEVYKSLNQPMRLFTNTFWVALQNTHFDVGISNIMPSGTTGFSFDTHLTQGLKGLYKDDPVNGITEIFRSTFDDKIASVNLMLHERVAVKGKGKESYNDYFHSMSQAGDNDAAAAHPVRTVRNPSSALSRPEPDPPFARELGEQARNAAFRKLDPFAPGFNSSNHSTASRLDEEAVSPTKRRKTSEDGDYTDTLLDGADPAPFGHPGARKAVSFSLPRDSDAVTMKDSVDTEDADDMFAFSPDQGSGQPLSEQKLEVPGLRSYGNYTPLKPTWSSENGMSEMLPRKSTKIADLSGSTLALRPKQETNANRLQAERRAWKPFIEKENALNPEGRHRYSEIYQPGMGVTGVKYDATTDLRPMTATEEYGSDSKPAPAIAPPSKSSGWLQSPKKYFNNWTGKWDTAGYDNEGRPLSKLLPERAMQAVVSQTRIVKQAFSNTNTPGEQGYSPHSYAQEPDFRSTPISPHAMLYEIHNAIGKICSAMLYPPHVFHQTGLLPTNLFDTLLCLNENEYRYLPLWAPDGNDDGTGGVFDEMPVPNLDPASAGIEGFAPGRIRRGHQEADSVMGGSDYEDIGSSQAISTVGKASKLATDGTHTVTTFSSTSSVDNTDGGTVILDSEDLIGVGEDARGFTGSENEDSQDDLECGNGLEFEGEDTDGDTINGDDPLEKEMSVSLQEFLGHGHKHVGKPDQPMSLSSSTFTSSYDILSSQHAINSNADDILSEIAGNVQTNGKNGIDAQGKEDKGKGKAQNHPYGAPGFVSDLSGDTLSTGSGLPYRERIQQQRQAVEAAQPNQTPQHVQPDPLASGLRRRVPKLMDEDEDEDDEYEFL